MKNNDLISIILPVYNSEKTIVDTIESIERQTFDNYELIIINDGSTDKSEELIKQKVANNKKIIYIKNENHGVSFSRNFAILKATGKYISFIDSDDLYEKDFLKIMFENMERGYEWTICGYQNFEKSINSFSLPKSNKQTKDKRLLISELQDNQLFNQIWNKMYVTEIIKKNNIKFDETMSIAEDWNFNLDYLSVIDNFIIIPELLYKYRISNTGLGFKYRKDGNELKIELIDKTNRLFFQDYSSEYITNQFIKQYYSYFSNIIDKRNNISLKEKRNLIKKIVQSSKYENILRKCSAGNLKTKVLLFSLNLKNITLIFLLAIIANKYDKKQKRIKYGL